MVTKVMNYEIICPVDVKWDVLGKMLRDAQYAVRKAANRAVQMAWDFENISYSYRTRFGEKLGFSDLVPGKKSQTVDTYAIMRKEFPHVSSSAIDTAIQFASKKFKSDLPEILRGDKSIPHFKNTFPIPIRASQTKLSKESSHYYVQIPLCSQEYKKETGNPTSPTVKVAVKGGSRAIFERLLSGEYKLCDSKILRKGTKWFVAITYSHENTSGLATLSLSRIMGVDLGIVNAAVLAFNTEDTRYYLDGSEIVSFRKRVEERRKKLLTQGKYCGDGRRGHGIRTRIRPTEKLGDKIARFRSTLNHRYSRYIVDMAVKHGCGVIQIEDLAGISKSDVFLKSWSYFDLQEKIKYKAAEQGIEVRKINPRYTSQRCSRCGHIAEGNRKTRDLFECVIPSCGYKADADYNAAKNISLPGIEEIIEKELMRQRQLLIDAS